MKKITFLLLACTALFAEEEEEYFEEEEIVEYQEEEWIGNPPAREPGFSVQVDFLLWKATSDP